MNTEVGRRRNTSYGSMINDLHDSNELSVYERDESKKKDEVAKVVRKQLHDELKIKLTAEVDAKGENNITDKEKKQRAKVIIRMERKIDKSKEKTIEDESETLLRKELIDTVLDETWLAEDNIKIIKNNEYCTSETKLALALCH